MIDFDPIELIEVGYRAQPSEIDWLAAVAGAVGAPLDVEGYGVLAYFMTEAGPRDLVTIEAPSSPLRSAQMSSMLAQGLGEMPSGIAERLALALRTPGFSTLAEDVGWLLDVREPLVLADSPALIVNSGEGNRAVISTFLANPVTVDPQVREVWRRVALHLGAALRMIGRSRSLDAEDVEVVVDDKGAIAHATGAGAGADSRDAVREAVVRVDRARTREGRADPLAALDLWQALLAGRWTLVEQFDSDGRRFVTARRNDPSVAEPRGLSRRQRQVVFFASLGWSLKEIGYALGLAESTINTHLQSSLRLLGLRSRAELVRFGSELAARGTPRTPTPAE